jgi:hypothetical protein
VESHRHLWVGRKAQLGRFWLWSAANRRSATQVVSKSSRTWARRTGSAQGTGPSAPPGSTAVLGCFSHQPDAVTCHPRRGKPAQAGRGGSSEASHTHHWPAGSDDAEARRAASGRCGGSAQSRGWCCSFDRGRSDLCWRHHQGSCGPFSARPVREHTGEKRIGLAHWLWPRPR